MKDWHGTVYNAVLDAQARNALSEIDDYLFQLSKGMGRITKGEVPNSSGTLIINTNVSDDYWFKPGINSPFIAYMQKQSGGSGTISSTKNATKGFVYLGSASGLAFDETNTRVGLNNATPAARLDMVVGSPVTDYAVGMYEDDGAPIPWVFWRGQPGVVSTGLYQYINETTPDDSTYLSCSADHTELYGAKLSATTDPGTAAGWQWMIRARASGTLTGFEVFNQTYIRKGQTFFAGNSNHWPAGLLTNSFQTFYWNGTDWQLAPTTFTAAALPASFAVDDWAEMQFSSQNLFVGTISYEVAWAQLRLPLPGGGGSVETLQKWSTPSHSNLLDFNDDGTSSGTLDLTLSGDTPLRISAGGGTSGLRLLTSSAAGRLEVGTAAQANMTMVLSGARAAQGTQLTQDFVNTTHTGTLTVNGGSPAAGRVAYATDSNGLIAFAAASTLPWAYVAVSGTYSILTTDGVVDCTSGTFTVTLPTAVGVTGKMYDIKNSGTGVITVATTSSQTIDGGTTAVIRHQYESITIISDGANWKIL